MSRQPLLAIAASKNSGGTAPRRRGRLSTQVLQEYYVVVTGKLVPGLPAAEARDDVRLLQALDPVAPDLALLESAWEIQDRYQLSFWDAQIVAAAQRCQAAYLLKEDLQDGQELGGVRVVDPFAHQPATVD